MATYLATFEPRRLEIFRSAAPLLEQHGYHGTTVRDLARACHLSPAGLYHHFASKLDLALFPIFARQNSARLCRELLESSSPDPLVRLRVLIDTGLDELPDFLLALRMADESGQRPRAEAALRSIFRDAVTSFATVAREAAPAMSAERAMELAHAAIAVFLGAAVPGFGRDIAALRARLIGLVAAYLVAEGVDAARLDATVRPRAPTTRREPNADAGLFGRSVASV